MFMMRVEEIFVVKAGAGGAETGEERVITEARGARIGGSITEAGAEGGIWGKLQAWGVGAVRAGAEGVKVGGAEVAGVGSGIVAGAGPFYNRLAG